MGPEEPVARTEMPNSILQPPLGDEDIRILRVLQHDPRQTALTVAGGGRIAGSRPVTAPVSLVAVDADEIPVHGERLVLVETLTATISGAAAAVPALDDVFIDRVEQLHQQSQAHHPDGILLVVDDDVRHESVRGVVDELVDGAHAEGRSAPEANGMPTLEGIRSVLTVVNREPFLSRGGGIHAPFRHREHKVRP